MSNPLKPELSLVNELYFNPKQGFISLTKLYEKVKENNIPVTYQQVKKFYESLAITQIMRPVRKSRKFNTIYALYPRDIYQMDIIVYDRYMYHNYKYILVVIDIYSRYVQAKAMTNREMPTIIKNFDEIMKDMGIPRKLQCDNEFNKNEFNQVLIKDNIEVRFSDPDELNKNAIVERFNGTIATLLQKVRISLKQYDWYNYLKDIIYNYNHTIHSTTKHKPIDIWNGKAYNMQKINILPITFKVGDKVRLVRTKHLFQKGDVMKYSKETYIVEEVKNNKVKVNGIKRLYKDYEVKKIADIIERNDLEEPKTETQAIKTANLYKQLDVDVENILTSKRIRKPNTKYE